MPVYDIAAGQQHASPIRSFYQGKALRADTELREKQATALQQEIDANLPEVQAEQARERLKLEREQEERLQRQAEFDQQQFSAEFGVAAAKAGLSAYEAAEGDDLAKRTAGYNASLAVLDNALPGGIDEVLDYLKENGKQVGPESFNPDEARSLLEAYSTGGQGTAKMQEARSMGLEPGTPEWESYLRGSGRAPSLVGLAVPVYEKMLADPDYEPTKGEQRILDAYERASPLERLLAQMTGEADLLAELEGDNEPTEEPSSKEEISKSDILITLTKSISSIPAGEERSDAIARFLSIAKEASGIEISQEEAEIFVSMFPADKSSFYPNADRGTIDR